MGTEKYNDVLSLKRTKSVKNLLVETHGIAANLILTIGHGERSPIASNETEEGRARNRRIIVALARRAP
jgi:OmpA-OmpF porin, OOP family